MNFMHILPVVGKDGHGAFLDKLEHLLLHILGCLDQDIRRCLCCTMEILVHGHLADGPGNVTACLVFDMLENVCCFKNCHRSQLRYTRGKGIV